MHKLEVPILSTVENPNITYVTLHPQVLHQPWMEYYHSIYYWKNPHISRPVWLKPVLFKDQPYTTTGPYREFQQFSGSSERANCRGLGSEGYGTGHWASNVTTSSLCTAVSPLYLRFHKHKLNLPWIEHIWGKKKIPEGSKKQNLNLLHTSNYLHRIYIVFTIIYLAFTLYLVL